MAELKTISVSDIPSLSEAELKAKRAKRMREYRQMLRDLCPSEEIRQEAKRISRRKNPCGQCVYDVGQPLYCLYSNPEIFLEGLSIKPCYEGVLRYLVKEAEQRAMEETADEEIAAMRDAPACLQDMIRTDSETIRILADYIIKMVDKKYKIPKTELDIIRELHDIIGQVMPIYERIFNGGNTP